MWCPNKLSVRFKKEKKVFVRFMYSIMDEKIKDLKRNKEKEKR